MLKKNWKRKLHCHTRIKISMRNAIWHKNSKISIFFRRYQVMPGCKSLKYIVKIIDPKQYESGTLIPPPLWNFRQILRCRKLGYGAGKLLNSWTGKMFILGKYAICYLNCLHVDTLYLPELKNDSNTTTINPNNSIFSIVVPSELQIHQEANSGDEQQMCSWIYIVTSW